MDLRRLRSVLHGRAVPSPFASGPAFRYLCTPRASGDGRNEQLVTSASATESGQGHLSRSVCVKSAEWVGWLAPGGTLANLQVLVISRARSWQGAELIDLRILFRLPLLLAIKRRSTPDAAEAIGLVRLVWSARLFRCAVAPLQPRRSSAVCGLTCQSAWAALPSLHCTGAPWAVAAGRPVPSV